MLINLNLTCVITLLRLLGQRNLVHTYHDHLTTHRVGESDFKQQQIGALFSCA